ncbi:hypothetical protein F5J12DRAFT_916179 [Pisolithus orientalis]|uniref:uncharacterized protein n=1 Tax=Pisolithus orientalis TaxID=936130 RepID=UPI0022252CDF|nr:uncharacterized protein F5J12DRAFT_916179 [Pisolithus orientalis]KAI5986312.1 hypothetical protein F5J12DRAFT_916179 [Pisolithus orientalis]
MSPTLMPVPPARSPFNARSAILRHVKRSQGRPDAPLNVLAIPELAILPRPWQSILISLVLSSMSSVTRDFEQDWAYHDSQPPQPYPRVPARRPSSSVASYVLPSLLSCIRPPSSPFVSAVSTGAISLIIRLAFRDTPTTRNTERTFHASGNTCIGMLLEAQMVHKVDNECDAAGDKPAVAVVLSCSPFQADDVEVDRSRIPDFDSFETDFFGLSTDTAADLSRWREL